MHMINNFARIAKYKYSTCHKWDKLCRNEFVLLNFATRIECVYVYLSISFLISGATLADTNGVSIDLKDEQLVCIWMTKIGIVVSYICMIYSTYICE